MIDTRLFDVNPIDGSQTWFHYDEDTGEVRLETVRDVTEVMDLAAESRANKDERAPWGEGQHVGWMPMDVCMRIMREYPAWDDQQKALKAWLNDSANSRWRSRHGRI